MKIIEKNNWNRKQVYEYFTKLKEPFSGIFDSVPKVAFSKSSYINNELIMNVSINANHVLVDGYHVGLFSRKFQHYLNK